MPKNQNTCEKTSLVILFVDLAYEKIMHVSDVVPWWFAFGTTHKSR